MNKHGDIYIGKPLSEPLGCGMELIRDKLIDLFQSFHNKPSARVDITALLVKECTLTFEKVHNRIEI